MVPQDHHFSFYTSNCSPQQSTSQRKMRGWWLCTSVWLLCPRLDTCLISIYLNWLIPAASLWGSSVLKGPGVSSCSKNPFLLECVCFQIQMWNSVICDWCYLFRCLTPLADAHKPAVEPSLILLRPCTVQGEMEGSMVLRTTRWKVWFLFLKFTLFGGLISFDN